MANTNKKLTHKDYFNLLLAIDEVAQNDELVKFIEGRIEQIEKKSNSTSKKDIAKAEEDELYKTAIADTITDTAMTISEMMKANETLHELSNQKISSLLRKMIADGEVVRTEVKGKAYFKVC
ncbi:MAG: hypothetical protein II220_09755 [Spirochaetales bacterium]|nr:hypothetical protein [Spirochaetales bacterium]